MNAYLAVVILEPTPKEKEDGAVAKIVSSRNDIFLARDDEHAKVKALKGVPEEHENKDDRLVVRLLRFQ